MGEELDVTTAGNAETSLLLIVRLLFEQGGHTTLWLADTPENQDKVRGAFDLQGSGAKFEITDMYGEHHSIRLNTVAVISQKIIDCNTEACNMTLGETSTIENNESAAEDAADADEE